MTLPYHTHYYFAIDIGNTRTKIAWFSHKKQIISLSEPEKIWWVETQHLEAALTSVLAEFPVSTEMSVAWISTARQQAIENWEIWNRFKNKPCLICMNAQFPFPIQNAYATPLTLGTDRIVAVIAAQQISPNQAVLVIDAGTAITYDFADKAGVYRGGGISTGIRMRFQALHEFTARLPLIAENKHVSLVGDSTYNSMMSGVINGTIAEIQGIVQQYKKEFDSSMCVLLTGGDAVFLAEKLAEIDKIEELLVLKGIAFVMLSDDSQDSYQE
jgi:type III pantothenate kinase